MAKDKWARRHGRITLMALGNIVAVIVDTMREADVPEPTVQAFVDQLEFMNDMTLRGDAAHFMQMLVSTIRGVVANDD